MELQNVRLTMSKGPKMALENFVFHKWPPWVYNTSHCRAIFYVWEGLSINYVINLEGGGGQITLKSTLLAPQHFFKLAGMKV